MTDEYMWRGVIKVRGASGETFEKADRPMLTKGAATGAARRMADPVRNRDHLTLIHYRVDRTPLVWEEFESHPEND